MDARFQSFKLTLAFQFVNQLFTAEQNERGPLEENVTYVHSIMQNLQIPQQRA